MKCPYCKTNIDDDSHFCDQCGKALNFCPECQQPKRGTECPTCGADLVSASEFFNAKAKEDSPQTLSLIGGGLNLILKEGILGRTQGIYPELTGMIYISGRHAELRCLNGQWQIRDLGSRNGTFVNGVKLIENQWTNLQIGDNLKIATTYLTVQ